MKSFRLIRAAAAAGTLALAAGCSNKPMVIQPSASPSGITDSVRVTTPSASGKGTEQPDTPFNAADALARKTADYSKQVQAILDMDQKASPSTQPAQSSLPPGYGIEPASSTAIQPQTLPRQASISQFGDSSSLSLSQGNFATPRTPLEVRTPTDAAFPASAAIASTPANGNVPPSSGAKSPVDTSAAGANAAIALNAASPGIAAPSASPAVPSSPIGSSNDLSQKLERRVKDYPRDLSAHLDFQLMRFLLDDRVPDMAALSSLPTEDRELMSTLVDGLINFRSGVRQDNNMLLSRKVKPLIEMSDRLRGQAELSIPTIALCTSVRTFGEYDPIEPAQFAAGKAHDAILYCEVDNFSSQLDDKHRWQTKLTEEAVLYTENGMQMWTDKSEPISDLARRRRHDFFIVKKLTLPATLPVGRYLMKVTIVDQQMSRVAEATVPLIIAVQ